MRTYSNTGVEFDAFNAPWNEKTQKEKEFECLCSQSLSKSDKVLTADYSQYEEEIYPDTTNTDWKEAWHDNDHYTPLQLIELFKNCLKAQMGEGMFPSSRSYLKHLVRECEGWEEDETVYTE